MDIQFPQILFQIINFGVVAGALTYFLYTPVKKVLDDRSKKVEEGQKAAEASIAEKRQIDELRKKIIKDAEKEAAKLLEEATQAATARKKELMAKAKEEATANAAAEQQNKMDEVAALKQTIKSQYADAVVAAVEKIGMSIDKKVQTQIIDSELDQLLQRIA